MGKIDNVHVVNTDGSDETILKKQQPFYGIYLDQISVTWSPDSKQVFIRGEESEKDFGYSNLADIIGVDGTQRISLLDVLHRTQEGPLSLGRDEVLMWQPKDKAGSSGIVIKVKRMQSGSGCSTTDPGRVQTLDLEEEYLPVVVASENGAIGVPLEALKAQTVASRTFAIYKMQSEPRSANFDVCDTEADQVYNPSVVVSSGVRSAVKQTESIVAKWNGEVIAAFFVKGDEASGTAKFVTVNEGKSGNDVAPTALGSPANLHNRGAMSQDKANELAAQGWDYQRILRYFYGADLEVSP